MPGVSSWSTEQVYRWATDDVGIDEEDARLLLAQKINGETLLELSEDRLRSAGLPMGPAIKLSKAIQQLKQGSPLPCPFLPSSPLFDFLLTNI